MLIHSATQVLTLAGGPQRGRDLGNLGIIEDGGEMIVITAMLWFVHAHRRSLQAASQ